MKKIALILVLFMSIISCQKEKELTVEDVITNYKTKFDKVDKIAYNIQKIDTFKSGTIWNKNGKALIEKNEKDTVFGFSHYGINLKHNAVSIYQEYNHFDVEQDEKQFMQEKGGYYVLGHPGGQMVYDGIFNIDDKKAISKNLETTENDYIITYQLDDLKEFNIVNRVKTVVLDKNTMLLKEVKNSSFSQLANNKQISIYNFSDMKLDAEVSEKIEDYIAELASYTQILPEESVPNKLLGEKLPKIELAELFTNDMKSITQGKITLLDFWEVWCGYCIQSFPKVEELKNNYEDLQVYGVVTENLDKARKLVKLKNTTFTNLVGDKAFLKDFSVNSFPRYFLIDKNGVVVKEYFGFREEIEQDIKALLGS